MQTAYTNSVDEDQVPIVLEFVRSMLTEMEQARDGFELLAYDADFDQKFKLGYIAGLQTLGNLIKDMRKNVEDNEWKRQRQKRSN
jgi:hypothetical protein